MKTLNLHVDYIEWQALKKAMKSVPDLKEKEKAKKKVKESLVVMIAVEKGDSDIKGVVSELVLNVKDIAKQVKAKNVVLYPYAHLSSNLASPELAGKVLDAAEKELKKSKFKVHRSPFGYYKSFELKVKGHPLSELSREIVLEGNEEVEDVDQKALLRKMSKVKMSAKKAPKGLKSNIELGRDLDLYIVSEIVGGGLPLFTPKGTVLYRELKNFIEREELNRGYLYTKTPIMAKSDLYKVSGHWQHYQGDMFKLNIGKNVFALRPMTCPFQFVLYKRKPRSYKDLPLKYAEIADLFRNEQSGELRGLTRVRQFSLADAHIICTPDQLEEEFEKVLDLVKFVMKTLGIKDIWYRFSKGDLKDKVKYVDNPGAWKASEKMMKKILNKLKIKHLEAKNEAAFYGPKLDLQYKDVYGKEDTLFTIQIDFALPEKFDMVYKDKNNKNQRPMIIHRSSIGAIERIISYLLEKNQGGLPLWLNPNQVKVLSMSVHHNKYCEKILGELKSEGIRCDFDDRRATMGKKVRDASVEKFNYMITIGEEEIKKKVVAVKARNSKKIEKMTLKKFISKIKKEIEEKK